MALPRPRLRRMDIAVLDLGATSFHLLHARIWPDGSLVPIADEAELVRLGANTMISDDAWTRGLDAIGRLVRHASLLEPDRLIAVGTSALRDAANGRAFAHAARALQGIEVRVLSADDEARATYRGARSELPETDARIAVIDLGGGSLEVALGDGGGCRETFSLPLGAERLRDAFSFADPFTPADADALAALVRMSAGPVARRVRAFAPERVLLASGTARTVRTLVGSYFAAHAVQRTLLRSALGDAIPLALAAPARELIQRGVVPARCATVGVAATVLHALLGLLGADEAFVSSRGLREGVALSEASALRDAKAHAAHGLDDVRVAELAAKA